MDNSVGVKDRWTLFLFCNAACVLYPPDDVYVLSQARRRHDHVRLHQPLAAGRLPPLRRVPLQPAAVRRAKAHQQARRRRVRVSAPTQIACLPSSVAATKWMSG